MVIIFRYDQKYDNKYYTQEKNRSYKASNFKWKGTPTEMAKLFTQPTPPADTGFSKSD